MYHRVVTGIRKDRTPLLGDQFAERDVRTTCPVERMQSTAENPTFEWDSPFLGPSFFLLVAVPDFFRKLPVRLFLGVDRDLEDAEPLLLDRYAGRAFSEPGKESAGDVDPQHPVFAKDGHADLERLDFAAGVVHYIQGEKAFALRQVNRSAGEFFQHAPQLLGRFVAFQADESAFTPVGVLQWKVLFGVVLGKAMQPVGDDEADRILALFLLKKDFVTVQMVEVIRHPSMLERLPMLDSVNVKFRQAQSPSMK